MEGSSKLYYSIDLGLVHLIMLQVRLGMMRDVREWPRHGLGSLRHSRALRALPPLPLYRATARS